MFCIFWTKKKGNEWKFSTSEVSVYKANWIEFQRETADTPKVELRAYLYTQRTPANTSVCVGSGEVRFGFSDARKAARIWYPSDVLFVITLSFFGDQLCCYLFGRVFGFLLFVALFFAIWEASAYVFLSQPPNWWYYKAIKRHTMRRFIPFFGC